MLLTRRQWTFTVAGSLWDIPAHIEFDYRPADVVAEVTSCYEYCRKALETR